MKNDKMYIHKLHMKYFNHAIKRDHNKLKNYFISPEREIIYLDE
ncbi:unnamed protein product [marine sediment metagenome]|uniref:Uncharacterized protein n=1 Tax=marine sediment metagenome TaxID=412755 RepID=X0V1I5_9ZZZZ